MLTLMSLPYVRHFIFVAGQPKTIAQGAAPTLYCTLADSIPAGKYVDYAVVMKRTNSMAYDTDVARKL